MNQVPRLTRWLALGASTLALAACGGGDERPDPDALVLHRGNAAEPLSLDPHKANGTWENNIIGDMFIGLFTEDPAGEPIPGMADSWEVSDDGLVWTFELRDAQWSDGEPVTAYDFEYAFQRILDPATLAQYASLLYPIKNARAVNTGAMTPDMVGVAAIDADTLQIELEFPAPYLPGLLTHYTTYPVPRHVVEEHGDAWVQPANIETNGPYKLVEWRANNYVHVERNEYFWGDQNVCIDEVYYYPTVDMQAAERRVRNGELDLNTDFAGQNLDFLREQAPDYVRVHPYLGTVYFSANTLVEPLDDPDVRNALAMAIDRQFIADEILRAGQIPAYSFVPPGVNDYPDTAQVAWADTPVEERRETAREILEAEGFGPDNPLRFEFTFRATGDNPRIAPVVQQDWELIADWVDVEIAQIETQIHYSNLRSGDYELGDGGWIGDYNDAYNFLFLAESGSIPMNYSRWSNEEFDTLVDRANRTLDAEERGRLLAQAEQLMLDSMPYLPIVFYVNKALVNPRVTGWEDNVVHIHRTRYLCFEGVETAGEGAPGGQDAAG
ncbi:peptide ABC transporter substrate-binding protein [Marinicauda salina]|uniref:Peptide ABC transporter substrate-binding protein n=1 Tax=Marinicauda salina TaxID=2135793 RepID=A0A2U2BSL1_9PROT|nr:peptide ABC transporter substrate-binding protein [Marinicauda salina]PWE16980.1 peptide ABC transporter substrate-binding protein [Marinicauda salina]